MGDVDGFTIIPPLHFMQLATDLDLNALTTICTMRNKVTYPRCLPSAQCEDEQNPCSLSPSAFTSRPLPLAQ